MKKWYEGIFRRQLTDMHINDTDAAFLSKFDADEYFNCLVRAKIQSPMIYLQSHTGICNYKTESARTHHRFTLGENELKRLIKMCKDNGMRVVGYYSLIFNNVATEMHPEWEMRNAEGKSWRDMGQRYGLCCPNNKEYREYVKLQIDELAREFDNLDGLFYDMPYWEMICACPACRERFKRERGYEIPEKIDWHNPIWKSFVRARQDWMVDFVQFVREYTEKALPRVTIEFNYAAVIGCDWLGGSTEGINAESEFTGGDLYGDLFSHSFACKYYYSVTKNQPFEYMTCRCDRTLREHTVSKPQSSLEREILLTAAHHGASLIIDAIDPIGTLDRRVYDRTGAAFSRQLPYEEYMSVGNLYAEAAVYFDSRTMFSEKNDGKYNKTCAIGAVRNLAEAHIPTAVISNTRLDELEKYKIIIAPSLRDFENDEPLKLIDYVKDGGTLYLSGASDSRLLKEFFDARVVGETYGDSNFQRVQLGARVYISPSEDYNLGEFTEDYPLPLTYYIPLIEANRGKVRARVTLPYANPDQNTSFASIHSCPPWKKTDYPAIIEAEYGKGKVIWIAAEIEYDEREAFKSIFKSIVEEHIEKKYEIKAGTSIEAVIFESDTSSLISLCDLKYDPTKRSDGIKITVKTDRAPTSLIDCKDKTEIPYLYDDISASLSFTLDLSDFAMIRISYE